LLWLDTDVDVDAELDPADIAPSSFSLPTTPTVASAASRTAITLTRCSSWDLVRPYKSGIESRVLVVMFRNLEVGKKPRKEGEVGEASAASNNSSQVEEATESSASVDLEEVESLSGPLCIIILAGLALLVLSF
jgi:hypothetical protein